jgi:hypothetical protein
MGKMWGIVHQMLTRASLRVRLNIRLFMRNLACTLFFGMVLASPVLARNAQFGDPVIVAPRLGDVLQGVVTITGTSDVTGFVAAEISFSYMDDPTGTWFLISKNSQPVFSNTLATWDTTIITDGIYVLRLRVYLIDGSSSDTLVSGLRVRNYSPVETPTPMALAPETTPLPTITPTATPFPTPTTLPPNPATLAPTDVSTSILYGGLAGILTFMIIGIYLWLRRKL